MGKVKRKNWIRVPVGSIVVVAAIAACSSQAPRSQESNLSNAVAVNEPAASAAPSEGGAAQVPPAPGTAAGLPDDRTPLSEPQGPIDPKSAEAAGQVVQHYGALIEQKRFDEAAPLWSDIKAGKTFGDRFRAFREIHVQVGKPADMEGAAGSIYITVPVVLYGATSGGSPFNCRGDATLRRVNDVPGSTERQRQWHISTIEC
jgi:hypothetical protein